jgi:hypothetical protein
VGRTGEGEFIFLNRNWAPDTAPVAVALATPAPAAAKAATQAATAQTVQTAIKANVTEARGGIRATPLALTITGGLLVVAGAGLQGYNVTQSTGNATVTAATSIGAYGAGGVLLLAGIIDGAINGWREKTDTLGELQLRGLDRHGPRLALTGGVENGMAIKGAW